MQLAESAHRKQSLANIGASQNLHTLLSRVRSEILLPFPPFTVALHGRHFHFLSPSSLCCVAWGLVNKSSPRRLFLLFFLERLGRRLLCSHFRGGHHCLHGPTDSRE